jgi:lysophospholipase L1-like esterase
VVVTLGVALGLIRLLAPDLLGLRASVDREAVRLDKALPPFYEAVFDPGDTSADQERGVLIHDPIVGHRRQALVPENTLDPAEPYAPFDLLGFRNRSVPVVADVVAIGDSLTVGSNATVDQNWPGFLGMRLKSLAPVVYNMSVGGWGGVQYLSMFDKAVRFRPRVVVVAYYTGNDPRDALYMAYTFEPWKSLRGQKTRPAPAPSHWPRRQDEEWPVTFPDGTATVFSALTRLGSNDRDYPGTIEAYRILLETARRMDRAAGAADLGLVFTVIPTKELVFAPKVHQAGIAAPPDFVKLANDESANIAELAAGLAKLPHASYVDVVAPLQRAALERLPLYPTDVNGHPLPAGYAVIASALAPTVARFLPEPVQPGLVVASDPDAPGMQATFLVRYGGVWRFASAALFRANGWTSDTATLPRHAARDLAHLPFLGVVSVVDPARFGPRPARH